MKRDPVREVYVSDAARRAQQLQVPPRARVSFYAVLGALALSLCCARSFEVEGAEGSRSLAEALVQSVLHPAGGPDR